MFMFMCMENPMDRGAWSVTVHGVARVGHSLATKSPMFIAAVFTVAKIWI